MCNIYKNIGEYNPNKKRKILTVFDDVIADVLSNEKLNSIVTELFIRGKKLNISLVFITETYFKVPKDVRLNTMHIVIIKIPNKQKRKQTGCSRLSDIDFRQFISLYKKCTENHILF